MMTSIRAARLAKNWTVAELCRKVDRNPSEIYRLETASMKAGPRLRGQVATALDCPEADLFDDRGWPISTTEAVPA